MSLNNENPKMTPAVRAAGFTDDWVQRTLGDVGSFYYGKSAPKWSVSEEAKTPCVRYGELYTKFGAKITQTYSKTNIDPETLKYSTGHEVLIPRVGENPLDFSNASWLTISGVAIGEMISVFNSTQNPLFIAYYIRGRLKIPFARRVEGGNVSNLYYAYLKNIAVSLPSLKEQTPIVAQIEAIDNNIALHQRKLADLQQARHWAEQNLLPSGYNTQPIVRVGKFPEWKLIKFGDLFKKVTEKNDLSFSKEKVISVAKMSWGRIPKNSTDEYMKSYNVIRVGDIAYEGNKSKEFKFGRFVLNDLDDGLVSHVFNVYRPKVEMHLAYWKIAIHSEGMMQTTLSKCTVKTLMMSSLVNKLLLKKEIPVPCLEEQQAIAKVFTTLDARIKSEQQLISDLQEVKRWALDNMFV